MEPNVNADEAELAKFSVYADDWWNPFGQCKPLHDINPLRFSFIEKYTALSGRRILDVGCGGGILTESLARAGGNAVGIDLGNAAIEVALAHAKSQQYEIHYEVTSVEDYALRHPGEFDIVTCMELLEHVPNPASVIAACSTLLKRDGHLFLSTINRRPKAYLHAILGAEYLLRLLPKGTHRYDKFLKPREVFQMLQMNDLRLSDMAGMSYNPFLKIYALTDDTSVNYLMHAVSHSKVD